MSQMLAQPRPAADRDPGPRRRCRTADGVRQRLSRRRADRGGARRRRRHRDHRPRERSGAVPRPADARVLLARGRLGPARQGHARRPPPRMRRARSPAATSPIPATSRCRTSRASGFRSPRSARTAAPSSPSSPAPAGRSTCKPARSSCSTRCTIPRATCSRTSSADFSGVRFDVVGPDRVAASGGTGRPRTDTLKVSIGYLDGYVGEGQMSYAGAGAVARGTARARHRARSGSRSSGSRRRSCASRSSASTACTAAPSCARVAEPAEARIRVVGRTDSLEDAVRIGNEVEALCTQRPGRRRRRVEIGAAGARHGVHAVPRAEVDAARELRGRLTMKLRELAHARSGDKGNVSNISVIAYEPGDYAFLAEHVTAERREGAFRRHRRADRSSAMSCPASVRSISSCTRRWAAA